MPHESGATVMAHGGWPTSGIWNWWYQRMGSAMVLEVGVQFCERSEWNIWPSHLLLTWGTWNRTLLSFQYCNY